MLLEELGERRNRDVEGIGTVVLLQFLDLRSIGKALGLLKGVDSRLWLGVDSVAQGRECLLIGVIQETTFLEEKR